MLFLSPVIFFTCSQWGKTVSGRMRLPRDSALSTPSLKSLNYSENCLAVGLFRQPIIYYMGCDLSSVTLVTQNIDLRFLAVSVWWQRHKSLFVRADWSGINCCRLILCFYHPMHFELGLSCVVCPATMLLSVSLEINQQCFFFFFFPSLSDCISTLIRHSQAYCQCFSAREKCHMDKGPKLR